MEGKVALVEESLSFDLAAVVLGLAVQNIPTLEEHYLPEGMKARLRIVTVLCLVALWARHERI